MKIHHTEVKYYPQLKIIFVDSKTKEIGVRKENYIIVGHKESIEFERQTLDNWHEVVKKLSLLTGKYYENIFFYGGRDSVGVLYHILVADEISRRPRWYDQPW